MFFYSFHFYILIKKYLIRNQIKKERISCLSHNIKKYVKPPTFKIYKRISAYLLFSKKPASMTVEASLVFPLFLFAFLNIMSVIDIYRVQCNLDMAMYTTVKEMAVYGHAYSQLVDDDMNHLESYGLTYLYGAGRTKSCMQDSYLEQMPIEGGFSGISWIHSNMMKDECIDLVATYKVKPFIGCMGFAKIPLYNRYRTRVWTGYDIPLISELREQDRIVYMTPEGEVYHLSKSCSYLRLSIRSVAKNEISGLRNMDGDIYYACKQCAQKANNTVFITLFGNRYHTSLQCSGLKRSIMAVPIKEVGNRPVCQKCGNG